MPIINFKRAIELISKAYHTATIKRKYPSPFFYIVGAGISVESIPLASDMVRTFATELKKNNSEWTNKIQKKYSEYFEELYYEPTERRDYLYDLMDNASITEANFMLAHLLIKETSFSNLVVTTNFDNLLTRALNLFGAEPLVFDHPNSIERINTSVKDKIQIVHVHGSYRFYDCCNLDYEIQSRANFNRSFFSSIFNYLMNVLSESSPLIIGYGGWNDVVIKAIKQRLESSVGYHYYWFCYDKAAYLEIDEELKKSPHIFFVVNDESISKQESCMEFEKKLQNESYDLTTLPATRVFDGLKTSLNTMDLELFNQPIQFFKQQLDKLFPQNIHSSFYSFEKVRTILENAISADLPDSIDLSNETDRIRNFKSDIQALGRKGEYNNIIKKIENEYFENGKVNKLTEANKIEFIEFLYSLGVNLRKIYQPQEAYKLFSRILSIPDNRIDKLREIKSCAWYEKARLALDLHGTAKAIEEHEKLTKEFSNDKQLICMENIARAYYAQGFIYDKNNEFEKALAPYQNIITKYQDNTEGSLKINVANAYLCLGRDYLRIANNFKNVVDKKGYIEQAQKELNKAIKRYENEEKPEFIKVVSEAKRLLEKAVGLINTRNKRKL